MLQSIVVTVLLGLSLQQTNEFRNVKALVPDGDKSKQIDVILRMTDKAVSATAKNPKDAEKWPEKTLPYTEISAAEYTYGKSPRVSAAIFVSPLFLFNASKSHWLTVKTADRYAVLRLDKSNYKLVIAELETRGKVKVVAVGENK